jgi:hypothetical protein
MMKLSGPQGNDALQKAQLNKASSGPDKTGPPPTPPIPPGAGLGQLQGFGQQGDSFAAGKAEPPSCPNC